MIKIKACKPFRREDFVSYSTVSITETVYNAGRKAKVFHKFGVLTPGITKERSMNLVKYLFVAVPQC